MAFTLGSVTGKISWRRPTRIVGVDHSDDMMPGVVSLPRSWGHDHPGTRMGLAAERPGANLNALLDETLRDPLSGNAVLAGVPVTMQPL